MPAPLIARKVLLQTVGGMASTLIGLGWGATAIAGKPTDPHVSGKPLPMTSIAVVADLEAALDEDDPGTGGGFQTENYFQTRLTSSGAIAECTARVETAAKSWAEGLGLSSAFSEKGASKLVIHYAKPSLAGFFVVSYSVSAGTRARVLVDFYSLDGKPSAPELVPVLLKDYRIAALQDALNRSIGCGRST